MRELGGYFEIEFSNIRMEDIHNGAIRLNTARNCLEYVLIARGYKKVFVPYYTCDVVLEPLIKHGITYEFYHIDKHLEPVTAFLCGDKEAFLYTNYFGIKDSFINQLAGKQNNLIIDNSQALFSPVITGVDTFYSLRKFVGTADGAFLYCEAPFEKPLDAASSGDRVSHLYKRKDLGAGHGYSDFKINDASLVGQPLLAMSPSTTSFLKTYDFEKNKLIRERNFLLLHYHLNKENCLSISDPTSFNGPLCYPYLSNNRNLKAELIRNGIFVPTYWPNTTIPTIKESTEEFLIQNLCCLPISQGITTNDINFILTTINNSNNEVSN